MDRQPRGNTKRLFKQANIEVGKTKAHLDLNVVRDRKGSKMISENVGLLLNRAGNLVTKDIEKAEISHILFTSVFTSKSDVKKSQVP